MRGLASTVLGLALLAAGAAQAGSPAPVKKTCPVGGETFTHVETLSYSSWGERPDGKPYGSWDFPLPLPVCPGNGLVMFKDFSGAEKQRLEPLLASAEYRAMVARETPYYRAAWLARGLRADDPKAAWLLLQASWEADGRAALKARYQREFAQAAAATPRPTDGDDVAWFALQGRAVNARRELGEFDAALAQMKALPLAGLEVSGADTTDPYVGTDAENRRVWRGYFKDQEKLIARRDAASEPLDMIPPREAAARCLAMGEKAGAIPACAAETVAREVERQREWRRR